MTRSIVLTVLLILLGVLVALPLAWIPRLASLDPEIQRQAVLWGLPLAAMLLSFVLFPRLLRPAEVSPGPPARRLVLLAACAVALLVDQSFLLIGRLTGWATFTAAQPPPGHRLASTAATAMTAGWALPACLILAIWGSERALRGAVYTGWRRRLPVPAALAVSILTGALLSLPLILPRGEVPDAAFVAGTLIAVLCRELSFALLFRGGGGLLVAGLYRGVLLFLEAFLVTDWFGLFAPAFNYVTGGPLFYGVRAACALVAAGVIAWVVQPAPGVSLRRIRDEEDFADPAEEPEAG